MDKELSGVIKQWNDQKGFGFIKGDSSTDVFFHITTLRGDCRPQVGDKVFYMPAKDQQGRLVAKHVRHSGLVVDNPDIRKKPSRAPAESPHVEENKNKNVAKAHAFQNITIKLLIFIILLVPLVVGVMQLWIRQNFPWAACLYVVAGLITFYLYWDDKQRAGTDARRIPEARLHFFEFLGGWVGAFIAQQLFRHKTRKISFQCIFWLIVIAHELFWIDRVFLGGEFFK